MLAALVTAVLVIVVGLFFLGSGSDAEARAILEREFEGAYPSAPTPTGNIVELDVTAAPTVIEVVDGLDTEVWAFNGVVPGQEHRITLGDTLRMTFRNELPVETTVHWHGVRVPNSMDGVPGITQPAIKPGESFTYEFTPPDAGTFFYHSHVNSTEQVERGLYGTLVVEDVEPVGFSQDVIMVVDDWSLTPTGAIDTDFNNPTDVQHNGRWGSVITVNGDTDAQLTARPGERIRLRFVNASVARPYALRFVDPVAQVIAIDGMYVREPRPADATVISPGGRVDVDITMSDTPGTFEIVEDFTTKVVRLVTVVVEGDLVDTPDFAAPRNSGIPEWTEAVDVDVDIEYKLALTGGLWTINGDSFPNFEAEQIEPDAFTKVRFTNNSTRLHPMHLHGQFFQILERNGEPVNDGAFRDSVLLFRDDVVDVGLVALDSGTWAMHCHILEHAAGGMITFLEVAPRDPVEAAP
jgi:FtsP/CotA-like multicopper oxidase with cupredoxin domain